MSAQQPRTAVQFLSDLSGDVRSLDRRISDGQDRADAATEKLTAAVDRLKGVADREVMRQYIRFREEENQREAADRSQAQADAEANRATHARYQISVFDAYNEQAPSPIAGDSPEGYRRRMLRLVRDKLSPKDGVAADSTTSVGDMAEWTGIDRRMDSVTLDVCENLMLQAAKIQANAPHRSTLPPEGQFVERIKVDPTSGQKSIEHYGRSSFIKFMGTPGRVISRACTHKSEQCTSWADVRLAPGGGARAEAPEGPRRADCCPSAFARRTAAWRQKRSSNDQTPNGSFRP
jgi:hypothetical protein